MIACHLPRNATAAPPTQREAVWRTFCPANDRGSGTVGFAPLAVLDEGYLVPGEHVSRLVTDNGELLTYVRAGALSHDDGMGGLAVIRSNECQRITARRGTRLTARNVSQDDKTQFFQIGLGSSRAALAPAHEQSRFNAKDRQGELVLVASPDGRGGSLHCSSGALVHSATLASGQNLSYQLAPGRTAWLHLVHGELTLGAIVLKTGDGLGVRSEPVIALAAKVESELLLIDLPQRAETKRRDPNRARQNP
jgi:redox-sensitive bicupin YhaK (pirin superfamily)